MSFVWPSTDIFRITAAHIAAGVREALSFLRASRGLIFFSAEDHPPRKHPLGSSAPHKSRRLTMVGNSVSLLRNEDMSQPDSSQSQFSLGKPWVVLSCAVLCPVVTLATTYPLAISAGRVRPDFRI